MRARIVIVLLLLFVVAVAGCGGGVPAGSADPAEAVERYLTAKVGRDEAVVRALLCSEMESVLEREVRSFESVSGAEIQDMACTADPAQGNSARVACTGQIVALYGAEETTFPLSAYRVVNEDGEWKWCGETE